MARRFQREVAKAPWRKEEIGVANLGHQTVIVSLGAIFSPSSFASLQLCAFALNPNCIVTVKPGTALGSI
jgi:hypothetical protein